MGSRRLMGVECVIATVFGKRSMKIELNISKMI